MKRGMERGSLLKRGKQFNFAGTKWRVDRGWEWTGALLQWPQHNAPADRFFDAANACITGLFGAKLSVIPFEPGLARVATRFIGRLRAIKRRNSVWRGRRRGIGMRQLFPLERPWAEGKGERNDHEREQKVCNWSVWLLKGAFNELNVIGNEAGGDRCFLNWYYAPPDGKLSVERAQNVTP